MSLLLGYSSDIQEEDLDMNNNKIINLPDPSTGSEPVTKVMRTHIILVVVAGNVDQKVIRGHKVRKVTQARKDQKVIQVRRGQKVTKEM